ncbi:MAG: hypothetical protein CME06_06560 [Gemmatimonadetes bacterium]|nr:hypothetical protein [Gemmatimonadota bacterium]
MKLKTPDRRGWIFAGITGGAAVLLPYIVHVEHHFRWDSIPGFYALYGGLGCALIVLFSKALGASFLQKSESWYGEDVGDDR